MSITSSFSLTGIDWWGSTGIFYTLDSVSLIDMEYSVFCSSLGKLYLSRHFLPPLHLNFLVSCMELFKMSSFVLLTRSGLRVPVVPVLIPVAGPGVSLLLCSWKELVIQGPHWGHVCYTFWFSDDCSLFFLFAVFQTF